MSKLVSMRLDDDVVTMIENYEGRNFTDKFQNLVSFYVRQLPEAEARLERLKKQSSAEYEKIIKFQDVYKFLTKLDLQARSLLLDVELLKKE